MNRLMQSILMRSIKQSLVFQEVELHNAVSHMISEAEEGRENDSGRNPAFSVPLAALRFVTRLATGIFSRGQKSSDPIGSDSKDGDEIQIHQEHVLKTSERRDCTFDASSQKSIVIDGCDTETHDRKEEELASPGTAEMLDAAETLCNLRTEEPDASECKEVDSCSFKRFDIAKDPSDHYFLGANGQVILFL